MRVWDCRPPTYYLRVNRSTGQTVASALQQLSQLEEPVQAEPAQHLPEDFIKLTSGEHTQGTSRW